MYIYWVAASMLRSFLFPTIFNYHNYPEKIIPYLKDYKIFLEKVDLIKRSHSNFQNSNADISASEKSEF